MSGRDRYLRYLPFKIPAAVKLQKVYSGFHLGRLIAALKAAVAPEAVLTLEYSEIFFIQR